MIDYIVSQGESYGRFIKDEKWFRHFEKVSNLLKKLLNTLSRRSIEQMYKCQDSDKYGALLCLFVLCIYRLCAMYYGDDEWVEIFERGIETERNTLSDEIFSDAVILILGRNSIVEDYLRNHYNNE